MKNVFRALVLGVFAASSLSLPSHAQTASEPLVFAAASLTDVLQRIGADFERERGPRIRFSFGSSATLARQIEAGARADAFVSADLEWMDYLERKDLLRSGTRTNLLGNRLVLVAPASSAIRLSPGRGMRIREALGASGRLAIADPASVPAGKYAKAALTALGVWGDVESRIAIADNVRAALMLVARGEAPLGIVYLTDAKAEPRVRMLGEFPADSHPPIVYPAALTKWASVDAAQFLAYLSGPAARRQFEAAGFTEPASANVATACAIERWDMGPEIGLFQTSAQQVAAATAPAQAPPLLQPGRLYAMTLAPQKQVAFAAPPSRALVADDAYAGIARFSVPRAGRYRVTVDGPYWIDVVSAGRTLQATSFNRPRGCPLFHKSVEFELSPAMPLTLQLANAAAAPARLTIAESKSAAAAPR